MGGERQAGAHGAARVGSRGASSVVVSGIGFAFGLVGALGPIWLSDLLSRAVIAVPLLGGAAMLVLNVASLVMAAVAFRRARGSPRGAATAGLVLSIVGVLGAVAVLGLGLVMALAWAIGDAAAVSL